MSFPLGDCVCILKGGRRMERALHFPYEVTQLQRVARGIFVGYYNGDCETCLAACVAQRD